MKRGSLLAISGQGAKLCLQLGTTAVLARVLSPADFGLASLIGPIVSFFAVFRDVGLTSATIYSDDITDAEVSSLFWINVGAGVVLAAVVLALSPLAALFYADPRLVPILAVMALTFVLNGAAAQYQALFQRHFEFRRLTVIDITANTAGAAVAITAGLLGLGYWSLVLLPVVTQATSVVCTVTLSKVATLAATLGAAHRDDDPVRLVHLRVSTFSTISPGTSTTCSSARSGAWRRSVSTAARTSS